MPEKRIVLKNCGIVNPDEIDSYLHRDGFKALEKARKALTGQEVIEEIKDAGLRGRGGAGFPCGLKWEMARNTESDRKFVICNADEGEMGTFKDRFILQNDPFGLIEGIAIACYATGAGHAYIYLREEYHFLLDRLRHAVDQASAKGFLRHVNVDIVEGAGAYVCGEETALMASIEGKRGEAQYRPPFPPVKGLFGMPTVINNVETLMNVPRISLTVNGEVYHIQAEPEWTLAYLIREKLGLTGTKMFCDRGACSSCTVIMEGRPILSCMTLAIECDGKTIETIEGIESKRHPLIEAYVRHHAMQCGYCTPGFVVTAKALLDRDPEPAEEGIRDALGGNLCRCGTYPQHPKAILEAAEAFKAARKEEGQ